MTSNERNSLIEELASYDPERLQDDHSWQRACVGFVQASFDMGHDVRDALQSVLEPLAILTRARAGIVLVRHEDELLVELKSTGFHSEHPIILTPDVDIPSTLLNLLPPEITFDERGFCVIDFGTKETVSGVLALYAPEWRDGNVRPDALFEIIKVHISLSINRLMILDIARRRDILAKASLVQLGKAMGSTLDIKHLARQITQAAMAIVEADLCDILLLKDGTLEFQVASGFNKIFKGFGNVPLRKDPAAGIIEHGRPLVISNIRSKSRFHERPWLNREQFNSYIAVPIKQDDQIIGVLEAFSRNASKFSRDDLKIFQSLAGPIAASLQSIRFFEETKQKVEKLHILHTHISRIVAEQDIGKMMKEIVDAARAAVGSLMAAAALYNPATGQFEYRTSNIDPILGEREPISVEREVKERNEDEVSYTEDAYAEILHTGTALRLDDIRFHNEKRMKRPNDVPLRGFLGVPLIDQGKTPCGIVMASFKQDGTLFTEADEEILTTLANQASIAIQNAFLYQQLEHRAKSLKNLFDVSQMISATYDSKKIQKAVIDTVSKLFDVKSACIALYQEDEDCFVISECIVDGIEQVPDKKLIVEKELLSKLTQERNPIMAKHADIDDKLKLDDTPIGVYFDSFYGIPLVAQNNVIGLLGVSADWVTDSGKTADDREILQIFANKAAIAMETSRLYEEALTKAENLAATLEVSKVITGEINMAQICEHITRAVDDMLGIKHGCIFLVNRATRELEPTYQWGLDGSAADAVKEEGSLIQKAFDTEQQVVIRGFNVDEYPRKEVTDADGTLRSGVIIPLVAKGKARGIMTLFSREPDFFDDDRMSVINIFTNQFAVAIRNNQLYARVIEEEVGRQKAELSVELLEEKAKSAVIIERTADGIFMVDPDKRIQVFNPALEKITGRKAAQVVGKACSDVFKDILLEGTLCKTCPLCTGSDRPVERVKAHIRPKNGETKYIEINHSLVDHGGKKGLIGTLRDITKDHELEVYHHDLRIATEVQQNILPSKKPDIKGLDIGFLCKPAKQIGGDYFDFIPIDNDKHGIAIGDVAGKSLPAALLVSMHKYILRSAAADTNSVISPLRALNQILWEDTAPEVFVTTIYGIFDSSNSTFVYANAGHLPPLLYSGGTTKYLWTPQTPLGIQENLFIEQQQVRLKTGDVLVLLSDGVTDLRNKKRECFGFQRLRKLVKQYAHLSAQELADLIFYTTVNYSTGELVDDFTIVVLKCTHEGIRTSEKEMVIANKPIAVNDVRRFVSTQLKSAHIAKHDISDILVAVCEAVTNSVMHGQSPDGENNNIQIKMDLKGDAFTIKITDSGIGYNPDLATWRPPDIVRDRGRGIFLMQELMDDVGFEAGDRGSTVTLVKKMRREKSR
ncbi:MAG TPA: GAF domain-containing protein [Candidatus Aquicultor sp.]